MIAINLHRAGDKLALSVGPVEDDPKVPQILPQFLLTRDVARELATVLQRWANANELQDVVMRF